MKGLWIRCQLAADQVNDLIFLRRCLYSLRRVSAACRPPYNPLCPLARLESSSLTKTTERNTQAAITRHNPPSLNYQMWGNWCTGNVLTRTCALPSLSARRPPQPDSLLVTEWQLAVLLTSPHHFPTLLFPVSEGEQQQWGLGYAANCLHRTTRVQVVTAVCIGVAHERFFAAAAARIKRSVLNRTFKTDRFIGAAAAAKNR